MASPDSESPAFHMSRGLHTSVVDNASAFGFSIMITASFGVLTTLLGTPGVAEIFSFALASAGSLTVFLVVTSRGFRQSPEIESRAVTLLGVALNFLSVGAAIGAAVVVGETLRSWPGWPIGAALASSVYIVAESSELALAELVQRRRGDRRARRVSIRPFAGRPRRRGDGHPVAAIPACSGHTAAGGGVRLLTL